jgi:hypothetical protein
MRAACFLATSLFPPRYAVGHRFTVFSEADSMPDVIFVLLILASYASTHLLIVGLAKLGRIE